MGRRYGRNQRRRAREELARLSPSELSQRMMTLVNKTPVATELMILMLEEINRLTKVQQHDRVFRIRHLTKVVAAWSAGRAETAFVMPIAPTLAFSFDLRMTCLASLPNRPEYRQFAVAGADGNLDLIQEGLLAAAGRAEIIELEGEPAFDPAPLFALALQLSPIEGNA